jgi:hypothetical protein
MNKVWVFFYGTFMSARILKEHGICCDKTFSAKLSGYSLSIQPRVNLIKNQEATSFGGLALIEQEELANLYESVQKKFGHVYYPFPVLAEMPDGLLRSALCYISEEFSCGDPESTYIDEMAQCAREMNAPESYILHIESLRKE